MRFRLIALALSLSGAVRISAAIIGTNVPAAPLTSARIAALPADQQAAWKTYLARSVEQQKADQGFFSAEMKSHGLKQPTVPPSSHSASSLKLENPPVWYATSEARHIADIIVSFQTPVGGWSKNLDMTKHVRAPGEAFNTDNNVKSPVNGDFDLARDAGWHYLDTFDNGATITQMRFLAKVIAAAGTNGAAWRASFQRGMDYIFAAQYPNGGWPQVWPLEGGYHDAITFNDNAMINIVTLLHDVAGGNDEFAFTSPTVRGRATAAAQRGIHCFLASQIVVNGRRTIWCQQHDALTLQPTSARNYEMPSLATGESAAITLFLMRLPKPDSNIVAAVNAAAAWFENTKITDAQFKKTGDGRELIKTPGTGPIWARYYQIGSDRPIFGDRDKTIHDTVADISRERRDGYAWFGDAPKRVLEHYRRWSESGGTKF